ncbi:FadR/GntR family transcriptional regulator [Kutzneria sp. NPDC052558]|uniref:FadR/GntR family transcriptional regulator n=1 Tax=Kutzneria sp. NPDC052558 TaxID=3364121 RepID=UPI0037C5DBEB
MPSFDAICSLRVHEHVAERIRRHIALGRIEPGAALPPERELARLFGVGRATVQQAVGLLEADRLIETRRGRAGGSFVCAPDLAATVGEVRTRAADIVAALDFRLVVEPAAAALAARHRRKAELDELRRLAEPGSPHRDTAFHLALAAASHNRFLVEAVEGTRLRMLAALRMLPVSKAQEDDHAEIVAALAERDAAAAEQRMRRHAERTARLVRAMLRTV